MRVGVIRDWESRWYADKADYGDLLNEDTKIREFLEKELKDAYISRIEIERTGKKDVKVIIRCARPGAVTGKADENGKDNAAKLRAKLAKLTAGKNVKMDIVQVANPDLDARLDLMKCDHASCVFYMSDSLKIHRGKVSGADALRQKHYGTLFQPVPVINQFKKYTIRKEMDKMDIVIDGLGWACVHGQTSTITVYVPENVNVTFRKAML